MALEPTAMVTLPSIPAQTIDRICERLCAIDVDLKLCRSIVLDFSRYFSFDLAMGRIFRCVRAIARSITPRFSRAVASSHNSVSGREPTKTSWLGVRDLAAAT
jgi:hypothetical protein